MEYKLGHICHIEIAAADLAQSKDFYGKLFGWTFKPMGETYEFFDAGNIQGALDTDGKPSPGNVLVLFCEDIESKLAEVESARGRVVKGKTQIPGHSACYAYFDDPAGNRMGLYATE